MNWAQHILVFAVRLYQRVLSPVMAALFGPLGQCRFTPSCSQYAAEAVQEHGAVKGAALAVWRVCRCNPWGGCGEDPVPPGKFNLTSDVGVQVQGLKFKVSSGAEERSVDGTRAIGAVSGRSG